MLTGTVTLNFSGIAKSIKHFAGTVSNGKNRYGHLITPVGLGALRVRENSGERHTKLKKDNNCELGCESKPLLDVKGACDDK